MPTIFSTACVFVDALGLNEKCGQFEECIAECSDNAFTCSYMGMKNLMLNFHRSNLNRRSAVALSFVRPCTVVCSPVHFHVFACAMSCVRPRTVMCSPYTVLRLPVRYHVFARAVTCSPLYCHVFARALPRIRPCTVTCSPSHHHAFVRALSRDRLAMSCVRPRTITCPPCTVTCSSQHYRHLFSCVLYYLHIQHFSTTR